MDEVDDSSDGVDERSQDENRKPSIAGLRHQLSRERTAQDTYGEYREEKNKENSIIIRD